MTRVRVTPKNGNLPSKVLPKMTKHDKISVGNHGYHYNKAGKTYTLYYCEYRSKEGCNASLQLYNDGTRIRHEEHTYHPPPASIEAQTIRLKLNFKNGENGPIQPIMVNKNDIVRDTLEILRSKNLLLSHWNHVKVTGIYKYHMDEKRELELGKKWKDQTFYYYSRRSLNIQDGDTIIVETVGKGYDSDDTSSQDSTTCYI